MPHATLPSLDRWCALGSYPTRRQRRCADVAALDACWREAGRPQLGESDQAALRGWLTGPRRRVLWRWDDQFPAPLAAIPDPPLALFADGPLAPSAASPAPLRPAPQSDDHDAVPQMRCCAIVGSRAASQFARRFTEQLAGDLVAAGVTVVSGLAQGIDRAAHEGALAAGGSTIAILGAGLGRIYPRGHEGLARRILAADGLLLSEYAPWVSARRTTFPERNRLISGLSAGVVVVQAALRSGSLVTARCALEQGREVLAVPGLPGTGGGAGTNALLRDGAALVESAQDVLAALGWTAADAVETAPASDAGEPSLLSVLDGAPTSLERLAALTGVAAGDLAVQLSQWEVDGLVEATPQGYIRCPIGVRP
ncbi:MAG: DNA-processing protein DprA [Pseudomonadota bacterium]